MSASAKSAVCAKEQNVIKNILETNEMNMTRVVSDKVKVLYALNAKGPLNVEYKLDV